MRQASRITAALALLAVSASPALPQNSLALPGLPGDLLAPLMHGALVFHGNYCGPGNKGVHPAPVDELDAACMRHDACTKDFALPACACNEKLVKEAMQVAMDPRVPKDEREAAAFTSESATQLPCNH